MDFIEQQGVNPDLLDLFVNRVVTIRRSFLKHVTNDDYVLIVDRLIKMPREYQERIIAASFGSLLEEALARDLVDSALKLYGELAYSNVFDAIRDASTRIKTYYMNKGKSEEDIRQICKEVEARHKQNYR